MLITLSRHLLLDQPDQLINMTNAVGEGSA